MNLIIKIMIIMMILTPMMMHPLSLGMILFIQIINISLLLIFFTFNSWLSYIMFLIMISGLLVLFIYMTSLASNEKFNLNMKMSLYLMMIFSPIMLIMLKLNIFNLMNSSSPYQETLNFYLKFDLLISKFMNYPMNLLLLIIIIFLFFTMVSAVEITDFKKGPLRSIKN